jgi:hypothetical protein
MTHFVNPLAYMREWQNSKDNPVPGLVNQFSISEFLMKALSQVRDDQLDPLCKTSGYLCAQAISSFERDIRTPGVARTRSSWTTGGDLFLAFSGGRPSSS